MWVNIFNIFLYIDKMVFSYIADVTFVEFKSKTSDIFETLKNLYFYRKRPESFVV